MKYRNRKRKKNRVTLRVWTIEQAQAALPYFRSIITSLREHFLDEVRHRRTLQQADAQPGRPNRETLVHLEHHKQDADKAHHRFLEAEAELEKIDVYSLDPVQGLALVPFLQDEQLAWFVFDLFDPQPFRFWRFQEDPIDARRPLGVEIEHA